jgi:hypothetical protein
VTIPFELGRSGPVRVDVFDVTGRLVATLADGDYTAGPHAAVWSVEGAAPGTYVVRLRSVEGERSALIARPR